MLLYSPPYIEMVVQGLLRFSFHRTILGRLVSFPIQTKLDVVTYYYPFSFSCLDLITIMT